MSSRFVRTATSTPYRGKIATVRLEKFRHEDGEEVTREWVEHPGAVAILALEGDQIYLVRQPREAVGEFDMLELPAGKLDSEGENALETAQRELIEEIGRAAKQWKSLGSFFSSPGFTNEEIHLFIATELSPATSESEENERIDVVTYQLADLDQLMTETRDAKTLIGLAKLRAYLTKH